MRTFQAVTLKRDVRAVQIPSGMPVVIAAGVEVTVTQSLGGAYTVETDDGVMARIDGRDGDALGRETAAAAESRRNAAPLPPEVAETRAWEELRTVYDPEIPVNVVDLGLVYGVALQPAEDGGHVVTVTMTLTSAGCGVGDLIKADAEARVGSVPGVREVVVEFVMDPPWSPALMTEEARLELGLY